MKVCFVGDISLNGIYMDYFTEGKNPFKNIAAILQESDYTIGNLESFAKGDDRENLLKAPRLTTTVETLNYLKSINLDVACLANNHVYDHLESGFTKTVAFLDQNGIKHLGADKSKKEASKPLILGESSIKMGLLNYVTYDTNPNLPEDALITPNYFEFEKAVTDIQKLKSKVDHIVLQLHWGGRVEGGLYPDYNQPQIAKQLIDEGADLIIGHHSHTFQPFEIYKGKYIFYSLGNFCFSDYWFEEKYYPLIKRRRVTGILFVTFSQSSYDIGVKFYRNCISHFKAMGDYSLQNHNRYFRVLQTSKILWSLYFFYHKKIEPFFLFLNRSDINTKEKILKLYRSFQKKIKI